MKGSQARTEHGDFLFKVSESADCTLWISTEPRGKGIPALDKAFIGFGLPEGTTLAQAQKIADFMNNNLTTISLTIFDTHPLYKQRVA